LADKLGLAHEQKILEGKPGLVIDYGKFKANLMFHDCGPGNMCTSLEFITNLSTTSTPLERVNDWNANVPSVVSRGGSV